LTTVKRSKALGRGGMCPNFISECNGEGRLTELAWGLYGKPRKATRGKNQNRMGPCQRRKGRDVLGVGGVQGSNRSHQKKNAAKKSS